MGAVDEDLRHGVSTRRFRHGLPVNRIRLDIEFLPLHALLQHRARRPQAVADLERALGIADAARRKPGGADGVVVVQHDGADALDARHGLCGVNAEMCNHHDRHGSSRALHPCHTVNKDCMIRTIVSHHLKGNLGGPQFHVTDLLLFQIVIYGNTVLNRDDRTKG